ncbi:MAG: hypothetical protein VYB50_04590 [Candidatus Thermoplasmatota archaeon]|nr:hypothetical protein [Candidatus Thermoplasmatota archaeon]
MTSDTNYVVPSASMIEVPRKMRPGGDIGLRSFRGIWCNENENNGPNLSQTGILLIMLGLVKARDDEMDKLGQKSPNITAGGGHTDIGQVTKDGKFGLSLVIQTLWPDEDRTSTQLRDEIQWLVFKGFEVLEAEADQSELMKKMISFVAESSSSEKAD